MRVPRPALRTARTALRLYPPAWRARYGDEVGALLDVRGSGFADAIDLARGAADAWLHPAKPSPVPPIAAISGGALWTVSAASVLVQPVPPDWPGYVAEILPPAALAAALLLVAVVGVWLRLGDGTNGLDRLAIEAAVAGHLAWITALVLAALGIDYGIGTATAALFAGLGTGLVGLVLLSAGDRVVGALTGAAALGPWLLAGSSGWLALGLAWSAVGLALLARPRSTSAR